MLTCKIISFENGFAPFFVFVIAALAWVGNTDGGVTAFFGAILFSIVTHFLFELFAAKFAGQNDGLLPNLPACVITLFGAINVWISPYALERFAALGASGVLTLFTIRLTGAFQLKFITARNALFYCFNNLIFEHNIFYHITEIKQRYQDAFGIKPELIP